MAGYERGEGRRGRGERRNGAELEACRTGETDSVFFGQSVRELVTCRGATHEKEFIFFNRLNEQTFIVRNPP